MGVNTIRACADRFILCPDAIRVSADAIRLSTDILIVSPNAIRISVGGDHGAEVGAVGGFWRKR